MLDAAVWSSSAHNGSNTHVSFIDWLPMIFSSLGMLVITNINKAHLSTAGAGMDGFGLGAGSAGGLAWRARVVLFVGFAALAGGMAGGVTVFVLKFVMRDVEMPALGMGVENIVANVLVGAR